MTRKYITEFGFNSYNTWVALLQQGDFDSLNIPEESIPQIYFIAKRPRISIDPSTITVNEDFIEGSIGVSREDKKQNIPFKIKNLLSSKITFVGEYPFTNIEVYDGKKKLLGGKVANLIPKLGISQTDFLDLQILYIGQSLSNSDSYSIKDRIEKHSTLQNIYSEAIRNFPDQEIWIGLFCIEGDTIISIDGISKEVSTSSNEDDIHTQNVLDSPISEQQMINFTEASLIKYFQPKYNKIYKNNFPNPAHLTYPDCYDLDINLIAVGIDTKPIQCKIYTPTIPASFEHSFNFPLHSKTERKSMFDVDSI